MILNSDFKFIAAYRDNQVKDIIACLKTIPGRYDMKDIHRLRVRIKRLRAIYRLTEFIYPAEFRAGDYYRLFKPVFKTAGLIRESQVNLRLLKRYNNTDKLRKSFSDYISKLMPVWEAGLEEAILSFSLEALYEQEKTAGSILMRDTGPRLTDMMTDYIYYETNRIKNFYDTKDNAGHIHDVRIILKNIKPVLGLLVHFDNSRFDSDTCRRLDKTEGIIGKWHDRYILSDSLGVFYNTSEKKSDRLKKEYRDMRRKLNRSNNRSLDRINESLDSTLGLFG